jgi:hypothetical protein
MKKASSYNLQKIKSEPVEVIRKLSDPDLKKKNSKLVLKPIRTHVSSKKIDIIDLISNNVVSERVRKDPREQEREEGAMIFETVQELDSEDEGEFYLHLDEEISEDKGIENYQSGKDIIGSGLFGHSIFEQNNFEDVKLDLNIKAFQKAQTMITQPKKRHKVKEEVVYEEVNDNMFNDLLNKSANFNVFDVEDEFTNEEEEEESINMVRQSLIKLHTPKLNVLILYYI